MPAQSLRLPRCPDIELRLDGPKGRGVFATATIFKDTIIDICPVLVLGMEENKEHVEKSSLYHYTYNWPTPTEATQLQISPPPITNPTPPSTASTTGTNAPSGPPLPLNTKPRPTPTTQTQAVVFGLGSMFNHSRLSQNIVWERDLTHKVIIYRAARHILQGEELCISYGAKLTFVDVDEVREREEREEEERANDDGFGGLSDVWLENFA